MAEILSTVENLSIIMTSNTGKTIDLTKLFLEINIYESIFNNFLNGKITILDTLDLISNIPITGNEDIQIDIITNQFDDAITLNFKVYKLDKDVEVQSNLQKNKMFILYICSNEMLLANSNSLSRKFDDSNENTIQWLLDNVLDSTKTLSSTSNLESFSFNSNYWTIQKIIDFICNNSKTSDYSDYIFFEDFDGFNFKPISELMSESEIQQLTYERTTDAFVRLNNIIEYKFNAYFDLLTLFKTGFFGSTMFNFNEINYDYTKTENTFSELENEITSLGKYSFFNSDLSNALNNVSDNYLEHDLINTRLAQLKLLNQYNLVIRVNGDFIRKCGKVLEFSFPNLDNENSVNESFDGKWFINNIKHTFLQSNRYEQMVLLSKNAAFSNDSLDQITSLINI